jgi:hypothetical protein
MTGTVYVGDGTRVARTSFSVLAAAPWIERVDAAAQDAGAITVDQHARPA